MEKALNKNDTRQFFKDLEKISGIENGKAIRLEPVRSKDGQTEFLSDGPGISSSYSTKRANE